jgi:hypothetical protein
MPAMAGKLEVAEKLKVFWFFSSEKNILSRGDIGRFNRQIDRADGARPGRHLAE